MEEGCKSDIEGWLTPFLHASRHKAQAWMLPASMCPG